MFFLISQNKATQLFIVDFLLVFKFDDHIKVFQIPTKEPK